MRERTHIVFRSSNRLSLMISPCALCGKRWNFEKVRTPFFGTCRAIDKNKSNYYPLVYAFEPLRKSKSCLAYQTARCFIQLQFCFFFVVSVSVLPFHPVRFSPKALRVTVPLSGWRRLPSWSRSVTLIQRESGWIQSDKEDYSMAESLFNLLRLLAGQSVTQVNNL